MIDDALADEKDKKVVHQNPKLAGSLGAGTMLPDEGENKFWKMKDPSCADFIDNVSFKIPIGNLYEIDSHKKSSTA